ncbi:mitogen-activated protein kinase kinase kinase kinase 3-like [Dendronephthya gigantea]|uniref:mitogen-activated protein kinase kinase kinase kinase 3-like n=1 Tax=Dendronephthya gigantea TaxID=151771 RepID=UPI00106AA180|nr:mitogen-activated protein kinase kinase kinase kinase 3-like [Dendronephthya gigantea]
MRMQRADISRDNPTKVFDLIQKIGSGTYGDVYKARVIATGELAAVKIVKIEPGDDFDLIQQEIALMQECQHENIVRCIGSYLRKQKLWIAMDFCSGGSLQDIYNVTGPLAEKQIAYMCCETLQGLNYLHKKSLIHRDIKGANILLTHMGDVKLGDFGISAQITASIAKRKSFIGTPYWMAPEVAAVERTGGYDQKCDIWAVGITAIELAELQPPLFELHPMRALHLISKKGYSSPTLKVKSKWTDEMHHFIKTSLQKNPKKRPPAEKLLTHPFCCQNLTRKQGQALLDIYSTRKSAKGVYQTDEDDAEEEDEDKQEINVLTRIKSKKNTSRRVSRRDSDINLGVLELGPLIKRETQPDVQPTCPEDDEDLINKLLHDFDVNDAGARQNGLAKVSKENATVKMNSTDTTNEDDEGTLKRKDEPRSRPLPKIPPPEENASPPVLPPKPARLSIVEPTSPCPPSPKSNKPPVLPPRSYNDSLTSPTPPNVPPPRPPPRLSGKRLSNSPVKCFSKIFSECPLRVNCASAWTDPKTGDRHILIGSDEGIYTLNISQNDKELEQIFSKRCTWLYVFKNILVSISGRPSFLYMHNLPALHSRQPVFFPLRSLQRDTYTMRIPDTKYCNKCTVVHNPYDEQVYLCVAMAKTVLLMQWYEPLEKFMKVKNVPCDLPNNLVTFEPIVRADMELPLICIGAKQSEDGRIHFDSINLNSTTNWFDKANPTGQALKLKTFAQLEKDLILIAYDNIAQFIDIEGYIKNGRTHLPVIHFKERPDFVVCLQGSILGFHSHGMEGRNLFSGQITANVNEANRIFRLLCSDSHVVVENKPAEDLKAPSNLYVLSS